jgi:hypothetical protein
MSCMSNASTYVDACSGFIKNRNATLRAHVVHSSCLFIPCHLHPTLSPLHLRDLRSTDMARFRRFMLCAAAAWQASATSLTYGPSSYAPPGAFPTQWYNSYYNDPTATTAQPQPVISDPVLVRDAYIPAFCFFVERSMC